ncbi:MAG: D-aminoacyl-tRNA deacylase [Acidimicrobiia bacterium]
MRAVLQRVSSAEVTVDGAVVGSIDGGIAMLVAVWEDDTAEDAIALADKTANLRIFADDDNQMNRSLLDIGGSVLLVSQFTLAADVRKGRRPSFTRAAAPDEAQRLILRIADQLSAAGVEVEHGVFGAMMEVSLVNDGPVTIVVEVVGGSVQ